MVMLGKVYTMTTKQMQESYSGAAGIVTEVLSSIRTVVAFGGEHEEIARWEKCTVFNHKTILTN